MERMIFPTLPPSSQYPIEAWGLGRTFWQGSEPISAFHDVTFALTEGEFATIIGPSGCGKTTLLNVLAGLLEPSSGRVLIYGEERAKRSQYSGYMFQKDLLLPWRTVRDNVALGLEVQGVRRNEARRKAEELIVHFGLGGFGNSYPVHLSGGMRQRAALMRTLLLDRPLLLLDEPFGALDALTRTFMQEWLLDIWSEAKRTVLFITHDIEEAVFLSDRVFVMNARPGSIAAELKISLPRPRSYEAVTDPEFVSMKHRLIDLIRN
jgi:ABC-type nitrate/sulfonate/bicarbonate transport system ATPase subunit